MNYKTIELSDFERDVTTSVLKNVLDGWEDNSERKEAVARVVVKLNAADNQPQRQSLHGTEWRAARLARIAFLKRNPHIWELPPKEIIAEMKRFGLIAYSTYWRDMKIEKTIARIKAGEL